MLALKMDDYVHGRTNYKNISNIHAVVIQYIVGYKSWYMAISYFVNNFLFIQVHVKRVKWDYCAVKSNMI